MWVQIAYLYHGKCLLIGGVTLNVELWPCTSVSYTCTVAGEALPDVQETRNLDKA